VRAEAPPTGRARVLFEVRNGSNMSREPFLYRSISRSGIAFIALGALVVFGSYALPSSRKAIATPENAGKIQHVVVIIQENRSFDNLFQGYPGADTVAYGKGPQGLPIKLSSVGFGAQYDIRHFFSSFVDSYDNGNMDGFYKERVVGHPSATHPQYAYVPASEVQPYFAMASQYVLADRMFPSNADGSFVSHQYAIAGQAQNAVNYPSFWWGCDGGKGSVVSTLTPSRTIGPSERACFNYPTIADLLEAKGLTWRSYGQQADTKSGGDWSPFQAVEHIWRSPNAMTNVIWPETKILQDVPAGKLANVTWVTPDFANSDHPRVSAGTGPSWVASVVNAIGQSKFWDSTVIFVFWDDWGGWYDHVPPPQLDYDGLGIRVPLLCISPYAGKGVVSHVQYETGSILRFIEGVFVLPSLSASDRRATSAGVGCINVAQQPRPFVPFATTVKPETFIHERPSTRPPDDE
jgi:phospholipase C